MDFLDSQQKYPDCSSVWGRVSVVRVAVLKSSWRLRNLSID